MPEKIRKLYVDYIIKPSKEKLHSGELLSEAGFLLLEINKNSLSTNLKYDVYYLLKKVSDELLQQAQDMGYTRKYDTSPKIKDYTYLSFELMSNYCSNKANRLLLPSLASVIYYENYNRDNKANHNGNRYNNLSELKEFFIKCLEDEQKYIDFMKDKL